MFPIKFVRAPPLRLAASHGRKLLHALSGTKIQRNREIGTTEVDFFHIRNEKTASIESIAALIRFARGDVKSLGPVQEASES